MACSSRRSKERIARSLLAIVLGMVGLCASLTAAADEFPVTLKAREVSLNDTNSVAYVSLQYKSAPGTPFCVVYATYHGHADTPNGFQVERCFTAGKDGTTTDRLMVGKSSNHDILFADIVLSDGRYAAEGVPLTLTKK